MVFGWLFGEKKRTEAEESERRELVARAEELTAARELEKALELCRELVKREPSEPAGWTLLGVNLVRRNGRDAELRAEAVIAWMRALALRPGDQRAGDHLQTELQYPDELAPGLARRLTSPTPGCDDAAAALLQIGSASLPALRALCAEGGELAERARALLARLGAAPA